MNFRQDYRVITGAANRIRVESGAHIAEQRYSEVFARVGVLRDSRIVQKK